MESAKAVGVFNRSEALFYEVCKSDEFVCAVVLGV